jgi:hypothetical protein
MKTEEELKALYQQQQRRKLELAAQKDLSNTVAPAEEIRQEPMHSAYTRDTVILKEGDTYISLKGDSVGSSMPVHSTCTRDTVVLKEGDTYDQRASLLTQEELKALYLQQQGRKAEAMRKENAKSPSQSRNLSDHEVLLRESPAVLKSIEALESIEKSSAEEICIQEREWALKERERAVRALNEARAAEQDAREEAREEVYALRQEVSELRLMLADSIKDHEHEVSELKRLLAICIEDREFAVAERDASRVMVQDARNSHAGLEIELAVWKQSLDELSNEFHEKLQQTSLEKFKKQQQDVDRALREVSETKATLSPSLSPKTSLSPSMRSPLSTSQSPPKSAISPPQFKGFWWNSETKKYEPKMEETYVENVVMT